MSRYLCSRCRKCEGCGRHIQAAELELLADRIVEGIYQFDKKLRFVEISDASPGQIEILHKQTKERYFEENPEPYFKYIVREDAVCAQLLDDGVKRQVTVEIPENWKELSNYDLYEILSDATGEMVYEVYTIDETPRRANRMENLEVRRPATELRRRSGDLAYEADNRKVRESLQKLSENLDVFVEWLDGDTDDRALKSALRFRKDDNLMVRAARSLRWEAKQAYQYAREKNSPLQEEISHLVEDLDILDVQLHTSRKKLSNDRSWMENLADQLENHRMFEEIRGPYTPPDADLAVKGDVEKKVGTYEMHFKATDGRLHIKVIFPVKGPVRRYRRDYLEGTSMEASTPRDIIDEILDILF